MMFEGGDSVGGVGDPGEVLGCLFQLGCGVGLGCGEGIHQLGSCHFVPAVEGGAGGGAWCSCEVYVDLQAPLSRTPTL